MQVVINSYGASVRRTGDRFVIRAGGKEQAISAHKVSGLVIATGATLTTDAIQLASEQNIDVTKIPGHGDALMSHPQRAEWMKRLLAERQTTPVPWACLLYTSPSPRDS